MFPRKMKIFKVHGPTSNIDISKYFMGDHLFCGLNTSKAVESSQRQKSLIIIDDFAYFSFAGKRNQRPFYILMLINFECFSFIFMKCSLMCVFCAKLKDVMSSGHSWEFVCNEKKKKKEKDQHRQNVDISIVTDFIGWIIYRNV